MTGPSLADQLNTMACQVCGWFFAGCDPEEEWSLTMRDGRVAAITCSGCMTSPQYLEGSVNAAQYALAVGPDGRAYYVDPQEVPRDDPQ